MNIEEKLLSALEQSDMSLIFIDISGIINYVNKGFTKSTGYTSNEVLGKKFDYLQYGDFDENFYQKIWQMISDGKSWQGEIEIQKKSGAAIWEQVKFFPVKNENGTISHFVKIADDVTSQRQMLDALVMSYDFIESIMNNINSIFVIDKEKKFLQINLIFLKNSGYNAGEIIGEDFRIVFADEDREILGIGFDRVINEKKHISNLEATMIDREGGEKIVSINLAPLIQNEKVVYVVGNLDDITVRKVALEKLRQKNLDMERDLQYAQMIIGKLLPDSVPEKNFLEVEYRYMPLEAIGGDFFSFFNIDDDKFGVFIGDVAGHGVSAALFLSLVKSETEKIGQKFSHKPASFIYELNQQLQNNMTSYFLTALYALFTKEGDKIKFTFAKGGHPAPVYYSKKDNTFTYLKSKGKPISLFENEKFQEISIYLEKGDRIFLYTDGLNELKNSSTEIINEEDFMNIIINSREKSLDKTLDLMINNARNYQDEVFITDDIVLIGFEIAE